MRISDWSSDVCSSDLRKAYAVAIYHHWERSALQWTNRKNEKHDDLARRVLAMGYPIDPHLHVVRDLANLLKHDNDRWGLKLHGSWPDVDRKSTRLNSSH